MNDFDSIIRECQEHKCPRKNVCGFEDLPAAMGGFFCWGCGKRWLISSFSDPPSEPYFSLLQGTREDGLAFHQLLNDKGVFVPLDEQEVPQDGICRMCGGKVKFLQGGIWCYDCSLLVDFADDMDCLAVFQEEPL